MIRVLHHCCLGATYYQRSIQRSPLFRSLHRLCSFLNSNTCRASSRKKRGRRVIKICRHWHPNSRPSLSLTAQWRRPLLTTSRSVIDPRHAVRHLAMLRLQGEVREELDGKSCGPSTTGRLGIYHFRVMQY